MTYQAMCFPILKGKLAATFRYCQTMEGEKRAEARARGDRLGLRQECAFLESTPAGYLVLVGVEAKEPESLLRRAVQSGNAFDRWVTEQWQEVTGLAPQRFEDLPLPQRTLDRHVAGAKPALPDLMLAIPIVNPGEYSKLLASVESGPPGDYEAYQKRLGIDWETHYVQRGPQGETLLLCLQGSGLDDVGRKLVSSRDPYDHRRVEAIVAIHGVEPEALAAMPLPEPMYRFAA